MGGTFNFQTGKNNILLTKCNFEVHNRILPRFIVATKTSIATVALTYMHVEVKMPECKLAHGHS